MLEPGVYGLGFQSEASGEPAGGEGLAVLRDGRILGSDPFGALFTGTYLHDPALGLDRVDVCLAVPPFGELLTGQTAGPDGAAIRISASFPRPQPVARAVVEIDGRPLSVDLTYIGPLPG